MKILQGELKNNYNSFTKQYDRQYKKVKDSLKNSSQYLAGYQRVASLQAWNSLLLVNTISKSCQEFFLESQNDALTSLIMAQSGSWRVSLQSLRSCIENTLFCMYYKDHPIELRQWTKGEHKLNFTETMKYFTKHPDFSGLDESICGLDFLNREYSILSKAVHASAKSFRMTKGLKTTSLMNDNLHSLGAWNTRHQNTLRGLNTFLVVLHKDTLTGASHRNLRKTISLSIPVSMHIRIRKDLNISLFDPNK